MKVGKIPARLAFYLLMLLVFFLMGLYVAGMLEAGKDQMLAGGAIVLGWGVMFGGIALLTSFFIPYMVTHRVIIKLNWILMILLLIFYGITHYRYLERQKEKEKQETEQPQRPTTEALDAQPVSLSIKPDKSNRNAVLRHEATKINLASTMGVGFFRPQFFEHPSLYFYGGVNLEKSVIDHSPTDSVVFVRNEHSYSTSYAPPWLFPEHLKLDYGIMIFKVLAVGHDFVQVEVNRQNHLMSYLNKQQGTYLSWPEFMLGVNSVEFNEYSSKEVFVKPMDHAGRIEVNFDFMQPLLVQDSWMYVRLVNENLKEKGKGWVRWRKNDRLLISYSLLS